MPSNTLLREQRDKRLHEMGYSPIWTEDVEEGMYAALEISTEERRYDVFGYISNLKVDVNYKSDQFGKVLPDSRFIRVRFFLTEDDGMVHGHNVAQGYTLWINTSKTKGNQPEEE